VIKRLCEVRTTSTECRKYLCDRNPTSKMFKFSEVFSFEKSELLVL